MNNNNNRVQEIIRNIWTRLLALPICGFGFMAIAWILDNTLYAFLSDHPEFGIMFFLDWFTNYLMYNFGLILWYIGCWMLPVTIVLALIDLIMHLNNKSRKN
ncbi:hypothetical protein EBR43_04870 [bacterium]|nr:hypothetical protein [bacterium]